MSQKTRILVVDDEPTVSRGLQLLLERDGHDVLAVASADVALVAMSGRKFDLVITDFHLPGLRGDHFIIRVREQHPTLPIILISAYVDDMTVKALSQCIDIFIPKPFTLETLRESVERALLFSGNPTTN